MREQFPQHAEPGEELTADAANAIGRDLESVASSGVGSFSQGIRGSANATNPSAPWLGALFEITDISDKSDALYKGRVVTHDGNSWVMTGNEYVIDTSGFGRDGDEWVVQLDIETRYPCHWDSQRGCLIPACCGSTTSFNCLIFRDFFDFYPGSGTVASPSFYNSLNLPGKTDWIINSSHWRIQQHFVDGEGVLVSEGQYEGYAEAINPKLSGQSPALPDSEALVNNDAKPWAVVNNNHPEGSPECIVNTGIRFGAIGDKASIFLGYKEVIDGDISSADYYSAEVEFGDPRSAATDPSYLRLYHYSGATAELLAESEINFNSLILPDEDGFLLVNLATCYHQGWLSAAVSDTQDFEPDPELITVFPPIDSNLSIPISQPLGDMVGMRVTGMDRDSVEDMDNRPIRYYRFRWSRHRVTVDDSVNLCGFCTIPSCVACESVEETPLAYLIEISGVRNNSEVGGDLNPGCVSQQLDQCLICDDLNAVFVARFRGHSSIGRFGDLTNTCMYAVEIDCREIVDPCPGWFDTVDPPIGDPTCATDLNLIELHIFYDDPIAGAGLSARLNVTRVQTDERRPGDPDNLDTTFESVSASPPLVSPTQDRAVSNDGGDVTCVNGEFSNQMTQKTRMISQAEICPDTIGFDANQCFWAKASFTATPLFEEDISVPPVS